MSTWQLSLPPGPVQGPVLRTGSFFPCHGTGGNSTLQLAGSSQCTAYAIIKHLLEGRAVFNYHGICEDVRDSISRVIIKGLGG